MVDSNPAQRTRRPMTAYLGPAALLNVPLILGHPGWSIIDCPWLRSLMVGAVVLLVPGTAWTGVLLGRGHVRCFGLLWAVLGSLVTNAAAVAVVQLAGCELNGVGAWNATWFLTNVAVVLGAALGGPPAWGLALGDRRVWLGGLGFLGAHLLFFYSATRVVPPLEDHDFEVLSCGYGMLTRCEPLQATDRGTCHQFSHPPLAYWYTATAFLYFDRLDYLAVFHTASRRAQAAASGDDFPWFDGAIGGLTQGTSDRHRVIGREGSDYLIDPPLSSGSRRIHVWLLENAVMVRHWERDPQKLPARTASIFLSALTVVLLGSWIERIAGRGILAGLVPLAYATSPEIFVRSGCGGHFGSENFVTLLLVLTVERLSADRSRLRWVECALAGVLLALTNQKLLVLPAAVVLWQLFGNHQRKPLRRLAEALMHPAALGAAAGTLAFWAWGLALDPVDFYQDHLRTHYLDRLAHHNPFGYGGYPSVAWLWIEFWQHTGYVLLPLGVAALVSLALRPSSPETADARRTSYSPGLWLLWTVLSAVIFSVVDWRQTKHLMPLMLPLCVAPARWAIGSRVRFGLVIAAMAALVAWNLVALGRLAGDFASLPAAPNW